MKPIVKLLLAAAVVLVLSPFSGAQVQDTGEGSLQAVSAGGGSPRILPLKHTEVKAEISGFVAEVTVTQVFGNPADKPIEAIYVFPLPEDAAVNDMVLKVADRTIKGQIKKRAEAKQLYEQAKAQGKTAALLDQERPNIFTQSVANIPPGHEIRVTLTYLQNLGYDHGVYKFNFPMTVGPRYIPGNATGKTGTGWAEDTDRVADASRITPPVVKPGQRSGRDISVEVRLNAGIAVRNIRSTSHEITVKALGETGAEIGLDPEDRIPNKDFLLTYEPAGRVVDAAVLAHKDGKEGYLTLMVQPKADYPLSQVTPKELVFAIDVSGSMGGFPVETAKEAALKCLEGMNPGDTFQILSFSAGNQLHFSRPLANTPENVALGRSVINSLHEGGGTEMLEAIRTVLEFPKDPERMRIVFFMTDGYIGNEKEILGFIQQHLNNSRIFPLGVGSSPNRYLLEEMAVMGKGTVQYVRQDEKPAKVEKIIEKFYDRISKPVLTDLSVDWKGLDILDSSPEAMRDLFAGQPVFIHARYKKSGSATIQLKAKLMGKPWTMPVKVDLPEKEESNSAMGPLWARARITELSRALYMKEDADVKEKITMLALEHRLVTDYTSFVAVDESATAGNGAPMVVPVESELPEGTRYEGFFGAGMRPSPLSGVRGGAGGKIGSYGQPKSIYSAQASSSLNMFRTAADKSSGVAQMQGPKENADSAPAVQSESLTAKLAGEMLELPSRRLARQLVSLQDASGAFVEPDGTKAPAAAQALALLALVKAKSMYGAEMDEALKNAWSRLRADQQAGPGCKEALSKALKGSPYWNRPAVRRELEALAAILGRL